MSLIIGYILVLAASIGTYAVHGSVMALWVPMEYLAIVGLMIGSFLASNSGITIKAVLSSLPKLLKGSPYNKALYMELLSLLYELLSKVRREGLMSIEADVENPDSSALFNKYPAVMKDHHAVEFMSDYLRMMVGGNLNAFEIENLMDAEIEAHHEEVHAAPHAVARLGEALPAFGIVVAVMGVVNVMGSVGEPPPVLGKMIGGALVGTFLGILIAYGFVQPVAFQLEERVSMSSRIYICIKQVLLASMNGYAPQVAVEFGRKVLFTKDRPSFLELEADLKGRK